MTKHLQKDLEMPCPDCQAATTTQGCWRQYNSQACAFCCARLIQQLGKLRTPTAEQIQARRRAALSDSVSAGMNEQEIRDLAKSKTLAVQPLEGKRK